MLLKSKLRELVVLGSLVEGSVDLVLLNLQHSVTVQPGLHIEIPGPAEITIDVDEFHWYTSFASNGKSLYDA